MANKFTVTSSTENLNPVDTDDARLVRQSELIFGVVGVLPTGVTRFMFPGASAPALSEPKIKLQQPRTINRISVTATAPPGTVLTVDQTDVYTVRKNGVDTALTISLTGSQTEASSSSASVDFVAGDKVSVKLVSDAASSAADVVVTLESV